jgi:hypothetical protein
VSAGPIGHHTKIYQTVPQARYCESAWSIFPPSEGRGRT